MSAFESAIEDENADPIYLSDSDRLQYGEIEIEILAPAPLGAGSIHDDANTLSIVAKVTYKDTTITRQIFYLSFLLLIFRHNTNIPSCNKLVT